MARIQSGYYHRDLHAVLFYHRVITKAVISIRTFNPKTAFDSPAMQAYVHQNLSNAGFGCDNSQSSGMKTCSDAGYITACKGAAGELLLPTCLHELN
jgi:hypothetical protein